MTVANEQAKDSYVEGLEATAGKPLARDRAEAEAGPVAVEAASDPLDPIDAGSEVPLRPLPEAPMTRLADLGPFEVAP